MRILLTMPFDRDYKWSGPDLGLGYLASVLRQKAHSVELLLQPNQFQSLAALHDHLVRGSYDLVGIKVFSSQLSPARQTIAVIRDALPGVCVVVGGPHISGDPAHAFDFVPEADYAVQSEAEVSLPALARFLTVGAIDEASLATIPGLVWRNQESVVVNPIHWIDDLDTIPFPAWDLMPPASFSDRPFNGHSRRRPVAPMVLTRGCPFACSFCGASRVNGRRVRSRSAANVMQEIRLLTHQYGVREIQFYDSNCASRQGPLRQVLQQMIAEGIDVTWSAPNGIRLDSVDEELVRLMKASGCYQVNVGIESGSQRVLRQISKGLRLGTVERATRLLHRGGIEVVGFFMLGFPSETWEDIRQTIDLAMRLPLSGASFSIYCPLPGTRDYETLIVEGKLTQDQVEQFDFVRYENRLSALSHTELRRIQRRAYLRFHLRPRAIMALLRSLNNIDKLGFLLAQVQDKVFG